MKTLAFSIVVGALGLFAVCDLCQPAASATTMGMVPRTDLATARAAAEEKTVALKVEGMTCGGCAIATRKALARLPGVSKVEVSYEQQRAVITYDPARVTVEEMIGAAKVLGYTASVIAE